MTYKTKGFIYEMSVFVIADLHLSFSSEKPMDVFGPKWENHTQRIFENWQSAVAPGDTVVVPGDVSWSMRLDGARQDLLFLDSLNGKKIIGKGNHDYWWQTQKKLSEFLAKIGSRTIDFLYNNAFAAENFIISGTRGWFPEDSYSPEDEKIALREAGRLRISLERARKLKETYPESEIIVFLHYPPAYGGTECKPIVEVLAEYQIGRCFYGHIHGGPPEKQVFSAGGARLFCVSSDFIGFKPMKINQA